MITRRDVTAALVAVSATLAVAAVAEQRLPVLPTTAFDWDSMSAKKTSVGSTRQIFRGPTATLDELELHVTTLNPGLASHEPHRHGNEEVIIVRDGTIEWYVGSEWKRVGPGSVLFAASNQPHGLRNVGTTPATYHVINWTSPGMREKKAQS
jgi:XRE family transcriptional regulator, regulator of sulfur utilization